MTEVIHGKYMYVMKSECKCPCLPWWWWCHEQKAFNFVWQYTTIALSKHEILWLSQDTLRHHLHFSSNEWSWCNSFRLNQTNRPLLIYKKRRNWQTKWYVVDNDTVQNIIKGLSVIHWWLCPVLSNHMFKLPFLCIMSLSIGLAVVRAFK